MSEMDKKEDELVSKFETLIETAPSTPQKEEKEEDSNKVEKKSTKKGKKKKKSKKERLKDRLKELLIKVAILIAGIVLLTTVFFSVRLNRGNDMYPSLRDGDLVISYRLVNTYMSDHVFEYKHEKERYFGRIIGVAGDKIEFDGSGYYTVNGSVPYEDQFYETLPDSSSGIKFPYIVPEDSVFLLSDYRMQSSDSRVFGAIPIKDLIGEVIFVFRRRGF